MPQTLEDVPEILCYLHEALLREQSKTKDNQRKTRPCLHKCTYLKHTVRKIIAHVRTNENKTGLADEESLNTHGHCQHKAIVNHATMAHCRPTAANPVDQAMCSTHQGQGAQRNSRCTTEKKKITLEENTVQGGVSGGSIAQPQGLGASHATQKNRRITQRGRGASRTTQRITRTP